jgi:hypothetical protein
MGCGVTKSKLQAEFVSDLSPGMNICGITSSFFGKPYFYFNWGSCGEVKLVSLKFKVTYDKEH